MAPRRGETAWFDRALHFATEAHAGFVRKETGVPFVVHPIEVALILQRHGFGRAVVVAGLLHDVVEDTRATLDDVRNGFGEEVAVLVESVSEQKVDVSGAARPWRARKEGQLARLALASASSLALKAADSLHNARSIVAECAALGAARVWPRFNASPNEELWYFREVAAVVHGRLGAHPLVSELLVAVEDLGTLVTGKCEDAADARVGA